MMFAIGSKALYAVTRVGLPPLTLAHVGLAEYGLWATCFVLVSYLGMTASGFTLVYLRRTAQYHAQGDTAAINRLLSTGMFTMGGFGVLLLAGLWLGLPWLMSAFRVVPAHRELAAQLWLGTCAVFLADMSLGAFGNVLHAVHRVRQEQKVWMAAFILETALIVAFLWLGWGVRGLLAAFALRYLFSVSANGWLVRMALPGLQLRWRHYDRALLKDFFGFGSAVQLSGLLATGLHSADRVISGLLIGPQATAVFDLATKLPTTAASAPSSVSGVAVSAAARHDAEGDTEGMRRLYQDATRMTVISLGLMLPFMAAFADHLSHLWLGASAAQAQVAPVMALLCLGLCWHMMTGPASALFRGRGLIRTEFFYHGLRLGALALTVGLWWSAGQGHGDLTGLAGAIAAAQTLAALVYLAWGHRMLTGSAWDVVRALVLPMGVALGLAFGLRFIVGPASGGARIDGLATLALAGVLWLGLFGTMVWSLMCDAAQRDALRGRVLRAAGPLAMRMTLPKRWRRA